MRGRSGRRARGGEVAEQTIGALVGALIAVEQARDALENVRGRFGRTGSTKRTRREGGADGTRGGARIAFLVVLPSGALAVGLLRRGAREETTPATQAP